MLQSDAHIRQKVYHPYMDGRSFGEQIRFSGNNFMTLAEKKQLIKYQLKFFQKETYQCFEVVSPSLPCKNHASFDILPNQFSHSEFSKVSSEKDFSKNIYMSTVSGMHKVSTTSCPRILINVNEYSVNNIYNDSKNHFILGSNAEFKRLLFLIEQLYFLYFQFECLKLSEPLCDQKQAIRLKLQSLLGFNQNLNNILPLKLMCVKKGCSLINNIFNILDLLYQEYILTLFIDHLTNFLAIYSQVDPNEKLFSHLVSILPLLCFENLCKFAKKLILFLDTCKKNNCHLSYLKIPIKLLSSIHRLLESYCNETLSEYQMLLISEITISQALNNHCNI